MRVVKDHFPKISLFLVSPLMALPGILIGIYRKSSINLYLMALLFGVLSFLYIPNISNDRARYFEIYSNFENANFAQFLVYLANGRTDFILHLLIFFAKKIDLPLQFVLFSVTSITVGIWLYLFTRFADTSKLSNRQYFVCFFLVILSFSLPDLFSGIRFYFSSSLVILAYYKGLYEKRLSLSIVLLLTALFIHFSAGLFLALYVILYLFPDKSKLYKSLFFLSLTFIFIPKEFITTIIEGVSLTSNYNSKLELYLQNDDIVQGGIDNGSANYILVYIFSIAWSFFAYLYLAITIKRQSIIRNILYLSFAAVNIFYAVPTIYSRYLILLKFIFVLLLIHELVSLKAYRPLLITLFFFVISILSNLIILRDIITVSYLRSDILSLPAILMREITPKDFLY